MSEMPNFRQEVPEIEEFVDWLVDHEDRNAGAAVRIQREALYKAYLKGQSTRPEGGFTKHPQCGCRRYANGGSHCEDRCELMPEKTESRPQSSSE